VLQGETAALVLHARDGYVMTVAALYETWNDRAENRTIRSCSMIITEPNKFVAEVPA
jgi:putative SOS response-associated peptidase YedK